MQAANNHICTLIGAVIGKVCGKVDSQDVTKSLVPQLTPNKSDSERAGIDEQPPKASVRQ